MKWYLIKIAGSNGNIFDFSQAEVADDNRLREIVKSFNGDEESIEFNYRCYDERINMHSWNLLADHSGYKKQHVVWVYSPTREHPWLSECFIAGHNFV